ncbi:activating molecule in BECN1-regulated autophagy protein 1B-like isoform X1 [Clavelina lepadiformis]|uniref:activating molecule in BECN1-regulated autophagy protein 1B-like isoform X1 n=1 Tax=Clavelina lepadiformis TaxID=159417 RepID=UPI0040416DBD
MSSVRNRKTKTSNICLALRRRSTGLPASNTGNDPLHVFAEMSAAIGCSDNQKANLPLRTRTTFMTAFSPDQDLVASCHGDHNVHVTNIRTKKLVKTLVGHERSPWCISFHPNSSDILATGCLNGEVRVWDLRGGGSESWTCGMSDPEKINSLSFHPVDHVLLIACANEIYFWDWSLAKPFVSVKTSSSNERVQLVRFDSFGSHILTGVANVEEEQASGDEDDQEDSDWATAGSSSVPRTGTRRQWLRNWLNSSSPVLNITAGRPPSSRPMTASYNLRGRQNSRTNNSGDSRTGNDDSLNLSAEDTQSIQNITARWRSAARQHLSDVSHAHTYSRDHERILHARVSVNAEIQHQYNRLQVLRQERRHLEMRLQQLQNHPRSLAANASTASPTPPRVAPNPSSYNSSLIPDTYRSMFDNLAQQENEAVDDYNEITALLSARVQARLHNALNDPNIEVSINIGNHSNPSTSSSNPSTSSAPVRSLSVRPLLLGYPLPNPPPVPPPPSISPPLMPVGLMEAPIEEPEVVMTPSVVPSYAIPSAPSTSATSSRNSPSRSSQRHDTTLSSFQRPFFFPPSSNREVPDVEPPPSDVYLRTAQRRLRSRYSRYRWRLRHWDRQGMRNIPTATFPDLMAGVRDKTTFRLQWWDFSKLKMPEISRSNVNVVVPQCKIHHDCSVDIARDGSKVAALMWSADSYSEKIQVGIISLEPSTFGQILFRKQFGQPALCLSLSPLGNYLAVGLKYFLSYLNESNLPSRNVMAQILKLDRVGDVTSARQVNQVMHPVTPDTPQRYVNINTIAWMPGVGQGLVYGTNNGELRICYTATNKFTVDNAQ